MSIAHFMVAPWWKKSVLTVLALLVLAAPETVRALPDIVVIVADDLGYMDVGAHNPDSFYDTPRLDQLAQESVVLDHAYSANPVCSPSRYALMTGRYPSRVNATNWFSGARSGRFDPAVLHDRMDLKETTIAEVLRDRSYRTAFVGKWHLGEDESLWAEAQGFDVNIGGCDRGRPNSYFAPYDNPRLTDGPDGEHLPVRLTDEAIAFLDADRRRPAFLFLSYFSVHDPFQAPEELVAKYEERAQSVHGEKFGFELRGGKGWVYEGGIRVPFFIAWPGVTTPGRRLDEPVMGIDLFSTLAQAAGSEKPHAVDGVSLLPLLSGGDSLDRGPLYWHYPHYSNQGGFPGGAIRSGQYKLLEKYEDGSVVLYNLSSDPGERDDLADDMPEKMSQLRSLLHGWYGEVNAQFLRKRAFSGEPWRPGSPWK